MSRSHRLKPNTGRNKGSKRKPKQAALAQHGIELAPIRGGKRLQVEKKLRDMEEKAEISQGIMADANDVIASEIDDEQLDGDFDFSDEDEFSSDASTNGYQSVITGDGKWEDDGSAFDSSPKFEILVHLDAQGEVLCSVKKDPRIGFDTISPEAGGIINELASRFNLLARVGEWLSKNRKDFLHSCDLWDFAEKAFEEAGKNKPSVIQKDFISIAELKCRKDSFSRFITDAFLVWDKGGCMKLSTLFTKEAKCAWVARAYHDYCRLIKIKDMKSALESLRRCSAKKASATARREASLKSMSPEWLAERLCSLVKVKGVDVVNLYGRKIMEA